MFTGMLEGIKEEALGFLYNVQVQTQEIEPAPSLIKPVPAPRLSAAAAGADADTESAGNRAPAALRASGADQSTSASGVIYTGPAEDGGVETLTDEQEEGDPVLAAPRRDRRAAKRANSKNRTKPPKSKKQRN